MSGTPLKDASARCPRGWRRTGAWPRRCSWGGVAGVAQILRVPTPGRLHVSAARLPRLCAPPGWCGTVGRLAGAARSAPRAQALQATGQWGRARRARRARWGAAPCTRSPHQERASGPHVGFPGASLPRASTRRPHGLAVQVPRMSAEGTCDGGMAIWTRLPPRVGRRPLGGDGRGDPRAGAPGGGASPSRLLHAGQAPSPGGPAPGTRTTAAGAPGQAPARLAGGAMLLLPGEGLLTIAIGLMLLDVPGKGRIERRLVQRPVVWRALNWIRAKAHRPPLERPAPPLGGPGEPGAPPSP